MINFKKQRDKIDQILREKKYRPSFFGLSVHFDWKVVLVFTFFLLLAIFIFSINMQSKINFVSNNNYSTDVSDNNVEKVDVEKFDEVLKKIENQ